MDQRVADDARARNQYGHFSADGRAFRITDVNTPRPWVNIIANERFGLAVSHTGSGFTWIDNSQLAVVNRWQQEFSEDTSGKFLYLRDADSGDAWSLSPAPTWTPFDSYVCEHGVGYTTFHVEQAGVRSRWTLFVHPTETFEGWLVELENVSGQDRQLELSAYLEWNCGTTPSPRREFQKLFLETEYDADRRAIFGRSLMWETANERFGHWNNTYPYTSVIAASEPLSDVQGDKAAFYGRYGSLRQPAAIARPEWQPLFGRHFDAVAALRSKLVLGAGETKTAAYVIASSRDRSELERYISDFASPAAMNTVLADAKAAWSTRLAAHRVQTPDATIDLLTNDWLRYQAISGRIWGRAGYYQQSGAYGFRDQLQDSQVWLTIDPQRTRKQLNLHAEHQFADGSVYHWWHPLTEQGLVTQMTDDLLWMALVSAAYIRETGDLSVIDDPTPFLDDATPAPLREHVQRAFDRVFKRTSPRGIPYIGAGDWNDGLSAAGLQERGESFWLGQFLAGLLADWTEIYRRVGDGAKADDFVQRREKLVAAINTHGWDGAWYLRGTLDSGARLGSSQNRVGRIFLNAQTWAILNDVADSERAAQCWKSVREHLVTEAGALLLAPAFDTPEEEIGYITRYAPGLRENGGVYTHAATWAIAAAAKQRDHDMVARLLTAMNPAVKDPERYWAEPYVLPGNVDGPQSPLHGRAGWTWYTGSAAWLHRIITHWVLGVRPEWDALHVEPCLPLAWSHAKMTRPWRGATYHFTFEHDAARKGACEVTLDGAKLDGPLIPPPTQAGEHDVQVRC